MSVVVVVVVAASNVAVRGGNLKDKEAGGGLGWGGGRPKVLDAGLLLLWSIVVAFIHGTVSGKGHGRCSKAGEFRGRAPQAFRCRCFAVVVG